MIPQFLILTVFRLISDIAKRPLTFDYITIVFCASIVNLGNFPKKKQYFLAKVADMSNSISPTEATCFGFQFVAGKYKSKKN